MSLFTDKLDKAIAINDAILVDTNLLLVLWIGNFNENLFNNHKRVQQYQFDDVRLLSKITASFETLITLPNILTEFVNLGFKPIVGASLKKFSKFVGSQIIRMDEMYIESERISQKTNFHRYGLTDLAIYQLLEESKQSIFVLTDEGPLANFLRSRGYDAFNYTQILEDRWELNQYFKDRPNANDR